MDSDDFDDLIDSEVQKAAAMSSDAGRVDRRSIDDLIKADRYRASKRSRANGSPFFGCSIHQLQQPGSG